MRKEVIGILVGLVALVGATVGAMEYFSKAEECEYRASQLKRDIDDLAGFTKAEFKSMRIDRLRDELRRLENKYGTGDCNGMGSDGNYCRWLKQELEKAMRSN